MKKRMSSPLCIFMFVLCVCAGWTASSAQDHGVPTKPVETKPQPQQTSPTQETKEIIFGEFKNYAHSSGWFSMSVPNNWTVADKSNGSELIITIMDPTENAVLVIRVWTRQTQMTQEEKDNILKGFLNNTMSKFLNFTMGEPKIQADGSTGIFFKYDSVVENKSYPMYGNSFIDQKGNLVGLINLIIPEDQYNKKKDSALKFINSFSLNSNLGRQ